MVNEAMDVAEKVATSKITHKWYPEDSIAQNVVRYAYKLWGMDFVYVFECENWAYDMKRRGDNGHAHWLCQINDLYHKDIPEDYEIDWRVAVEYCYQKWKGGTKFYWPGRIIKGQKCANYVSNRFIIE